MAGGKGKVEAIISLIGEDKITKIIQDVEAGLKNVDDETKNASDSTTGMAEQWATVATGINQGIELLQKAGQAAQWAMEQVRTGAKEQATHAMFLQMTKDIGGAGLAIDALDKAAAGGLAQTQMQDLSMKALRANMSLGQTVQMFELARKAAHAGLGEQTELTEQFIQGIVDRSDSVFKAMGLEVDFGMEVAKAATKMGVSADALGLNNQRTIAFNKAVSELTVALKDVPFSETIANLNAWEAAVDDLARAQRLQKMVEMGIGAEDVQRSNELLRNLKFMSEERYKSGNMPLWFDMDESSGVEWQKNVAKAFDTSGDHGRGWISVLAEIQRQEAVGNKEAIAQMRELRKHGKITESNTVLRAAVERRMKAQHMDQLRAEIALLKEQGGIGFMQFENLIQQEIRAVQSQAQRHGGLMDMATAQGIVLGKYGLTAIMLDHLTNQEDAHVKAMNKGVDVSRHLTSENQRKIATYQKLLNDLPELSKMTGQQVRADQNLKDVQMEVIDSLVERGEVTKTVGFVLSELIHAGQLGTEVKMTSNEVEERHIKLQHDAIDALANQQSMLFKNSIIQAEYAASLGRTKMATDLWRKAATAIPSAMAMAASATIPQMEKIAKATKAVAATAILAQAKVMEASTLLAEEKMGEALFAGDMASVKAYVEQIGKAQAATAALKQKVAEAIAMAGSGGGGGGGSRAAKAADAAEKARKKDAADTIKMLAYKEEMRKADRAGHITAVQAAIDRQNAQIADLDGTNEQISLEQKLVVQKLQLRKAEEELGGQIAKTRREREEAGGTQPELLLLTKEEQLIAGLREKIKASQQAIIDSHAEIAQQVQDTARNSLSNAVAHAGQFGNHWADAFGQSLQIIDQEISKFEALQAKMGASQDAASKALTKSVPSMIAASGAIAGAFIEDAQWRAGVMGAMEFAASMASLAIPDYKASAMHGLASILYFAVAAKSGKKSGGGGGRAAGKYTPVAMTPQKAKTGEGGTQAITLNFSGTVVGTDETAARALASMIRRELRWNAMAPTAAA